MKISGALIAWNEASTIDLTLQALQGFVDEVTLVDTGSFDGTQGRAEECMQELDLPGEVLSVRITDLIDARMAAIEGCTHECILLIDADLVLSEALKVSLRWGAEKGVACKAKSLNLVGDYEHVFTPQPFHAHHTILFTRDQIWWDWKRLRSTPRSDGVHLRPWSVNLSRVRPAWRMWYRGEPFMDSEQDVLVGWMRSGKYPSAVEYIEAEHGLSLEDVKKLAPGWLLNILRTAASPIGGKRRRLLPEPIKREIEDPRFRLVYRDGEIVGRWPEF